MVKKTFSVLLGGIIILGIIGIGQASIVINLNSEIEYPSNQITVFFEAGTYNVTPIGVADGGTYNSWNAWGIVDLPEQGWVNLYYFSSTEFGQIVIYDDIRYASELSALYNALSTSFTLTSDANVNFYVKDSPFSDNVGGMSLRIDADPSPIPTLSEWGMIIFLILLVGSAMWVIKRRTDQESA